MTDERDKESLYLQGELYERIALAENAYKQADAHRYEGPSHYQFGCEGDQFCRMLVEYMDDMRDECATELIRFDVSSALYDTAWEHYPDFAPLLDGDPIRPQPSESPDGLIYRRNPEDPLWVSAECGYFCGGETFYINAKVYDEASTYGIDEGRVSKLAISRNDCDWNPAHLVASYDRGWDVYPDDPAYQEMLAWVIGELDNIAPIGQ